MLAIAALVLALSCTKRERDEVFNGERVDEASEKGLLEGHVHLFELVQWGAPTGGIVATKRAERDELRLAVAKLQVELLEAKIERGVMEEREMKVIRVKYTADDWEKQKAKVKRPPDGKIENSTTMAPQQPGRPAHEVPAVIVEQLQEQMPKEVVRTPEAARAFWAPKVVEAQQALAKAQEAVDQAKAAGEGAAAATAPPVEKTKVSFAVLPLRMRSVMFEPPRDPRGYHCGVCESGAKQRRAFVLSATGGVSPQPPAFADRAALEKGVELTERVTVNGLDSESGKQLDPKDGKLVLRLVGHCPVRVYHAKEEVTVNPGFVISIPKSVGFAEWYEIPIPKCAGEQALGTHVFDLLAGAAAKQEPAIDSELLRLKGEFGFTDERLKRVRGIPVP
jgi:hypothetical protein